MTFHQKVIATSDIREHELVIIMNGLARPAYEGEPTSVTSADAIKQGEVAVYDTNERILRRKK